MKNKKHGSRSWGGSTSTVVGITLVMFVFGLLMFVEYHSYRATHDMQERITFKVDLKEDATDSVALALKQQIEQYPYVKQVDYISKEEAAQLFAEVLDEDFVGFLGYNPLSPSLMVNFRSGILPEHEQNLITQFKTQVAANAYVEGVQYQEHVVNELFDQLYKISWFLIIFIVLLLFVCIMLINNTIRLAIFTQSQTIQTMRLVGAKTSFIARPYLLRSLLYGLLGGLLADVLLGVAIFSFSTRFGLNVYDQQHFIPYIIMATGIPVVGIIIAYCSTWISVRHALKITEK